MSLKVKVDTKGLQDLIRTSPQKVDRWLAGVAEQMVGDIKVSFNTGPAGRSYKRGSRYHVASSPGYPPNVDTGTLRASIRQTPAGHLTRHIVAGTEYAEPIEFGTSKMAARPYMGPVFAAWQGKIEDDAKENLDLE